MRRGLVLFVLVGLVVVTAACGSGGGHASDDLADLDTPIETSPGCVRHIDAIVFVDPAVPDTGLDAIGASLAAIPGVVKIDRVDKELAYQDFLRLFPQSPYTTSITPDDLPASFQVSMDDPAHVSRLQTAAAGIDGVGQVVLSSDAPDAETATIPC